VAFSVSDKSAQLPPEKNSPGIRGRDWRRDDNSCRVGPAARVGVKLLSGQVSMAVGDGLEPGDKERGIILACQAKSNGKLVVEHEMKERQRIVLSGLVVSS